MANQRLLFPRGSLTFSRAAVKIGHAKSVRMKQVVTSGPELILPLLVTLIFTELRHASVLNSPDVHFWKRRGDAVPLSIDMDQDDYEIAVGKHIVHIDAECASG